MERAGSARMWSDWTVVMSLRLEQEGRVCRELGAVRLEAMQGQHEGLWHMPSAKCWGANVTTRGEAMTPCQPTHIPTTPSWESQGQSGHLGQIRPNWLSCLILLFN